MNEQQISFNGLSEYHTWKEEHYQSQDGVKEVGCYWDLDGKIHVHYINVRE